MDVPIYRGSSLVIHYSIAVLLIPICVSFLSFGAWQVQWIAAGHGALNWNLALAAWQINASVGVLLLIEAYTLVGVLLLLGLDARAARVGMPTLIGVLSVVFWTAAVIGLVASFVARLHSPAALDELEPYFSWIATLFRTIGLTLFGRIFFGFRLARSIALLVVISAFECLLLPWLSETMLSWVLM